MKARIILLYCVFFTIAGCFSQNSIDKAIKTFCNANGLESASVSFEVVDLSNGSQISSHNPKLILPTASTAKLFATATALEILGPDYKASTRVYLDGLIDSLGVLHGDIWIRGGGDPSLGSKYFNEEGHELDFMLAWIDSLKSIGIKNIDGSVITDASEFGYEGAPDGWNWVDMGNYYGAGPSGLTIYDNLLRYTFSTPNTPGRLSKLKSIEPAVPGIIFHNGVLSSERRGDNAYIYGAPFSYDRFSSGTLPAGSSAFIVKGSLPDPEFQFAYEFDRLLELEGINVSDTIKTMRSMHKRSTDADYESKRLVITHKGERLLNIIEQTNMRSVNLFAEHMVSLVGYAKTGNGSTSSGIRILNAYWKERIFSDNLYVTDGSGLSRTNAICAAHFNSLLAYMAKSKYADEFFSSLPIAGTSGTLLNVCRGQTAQGRLFAKSGSMSRIKSYAGYINTKSGKEFSFALIVNNATCSSSILKRKMEIVFNTIAAY